jgi:hypothetical protein
LARPKTKGDPIHIRLPLAEDTTFRTLAASRSLKPAELAKEQVLGYEKYKKLKTAYVQAESERIRHVHLAAYSQFMDVQESVDEARKKLAHILEGKT